jgi:hypothetical protein
MELVALSVGIIKPVGEVLPVESRDPQKLDAKIAAAVLGVRRCFATKIMVTSYLAHPQRHKSATRSSQ